MILEMLGADQLYLDIFPGLHSGLFHHEPHRIYLSDPQFGDLCNGYNSSRCLNEMISLIDSTAVDGCPTMCPELSEVQTHGK